MEDQEKSTKINKKTLFKIITVILCVVLFVILVSIALFQNTFPEIKPELLRPIIVSLDTQKDYNFEYPVYKGEKVEIINPVYRGEPFEIKLLKN